MALVEVGGRELDAILAAGSLHLRVSREREVDWSSVRGLDRAESVLA